MSQWTVILTNLGHDELAKAESAMEAPAVQSEGLGTPTPAELLDLAQEIDERILSANWMLERDYRGHYRFTLFFPTGNEPTIIPF